MLDAASRDDAVDREPVVPDRKKRKSSKSRALCPTPHKKTYRDARDALGGAKRLARLIVSDNRHLPPLYGYVCSCKKWHITKLAEWGGVPHLHLWTVPDALQAWARGEDTPAG